MQEWSGSAVFLHFSASFCRLLRSERKVFAYRLLIDADQGRIRRLSGTSRRENNEGEIAVERRSAGVERVDEAVA